ncbi:unnamed protein product [Chondrus crispus]|uniref:Uncharacterized protein n=1 Tax=Chondrus crispus TaxID=2769 RepID=R7Q6A1_CHOCR|nr:unnamed protein product [Chondrus crispus]CDF33378.1 unnamed protein product [Chondrus crispus]|eukprot:XP_005713181.1 unnamed protein product [Chondrus crispus]
MTAIMLRNHSKYLPVPSTCPLPIRIVFARGLHCPVASCASHCILPSRRKPPETLQSGSFRVQYLDRATFTKMEIIDKCETRDERNQFVSSIVVYNDGANYYYAESSTLEPEDIDEDNVEKLEKVVLIPVGHIFPAVAPNLRTVESCDANVQFLKKPRLTGYSPTTTECHSRPLLARGQRA